jgi:hypothetical protein
MELAYYSQLFENPKELLACEDQELAYWLVFDEPRMLVCGNDLKIALVEMRLLQQMSSLPWRHEMFR